MSIFDKLFNHAKKDEENPEEVQENLNKAEKSPEQAFNDKYAIEKIDGVWYNKATGEPVGEANPVESKKANPDDAPDEPELNKDIPKDDDNVR